MAMGLSYLNVVMLRGLDSTMMTSMSRGTTVIIPIGIATFNLRLFTAATWTW
jgi:hypothetical protein